MAAQTFTATDRSNLLRRTIQADAVFTLLGGLLLAIDAGPIAALIGLPDPGILTALGLLCVGYSALLFLAARRSPIDRGQARAFMLADVAWVVASAAILLGGWAPLNTSGVWSVLIVADIVAVFAALKYVGLRRLA
ncbi:MAG TPA: hypothetical protein VFO07_06500 [Roseiflexaceae bacterium]|nr:hypothetical protein [Roseiflexaceae bacterium]